MGNTSDGIVTPLQPPFRLMSRWKRLNPETARSLLEALFHSDASVDPDPEAGTLTGPLLLQATVARDRALAPLIEQLNSTRTVFPDTQLRLVYEMVPDAPSGPVALCTRPTVPTSPPASTKTKRFNEVCDKAW